MNDKDQPSMNYQRKTHWLYREENRPKLWKILAVLLVLVVLPEFFVHHYPYFKEQGISINASWGFYIWFGFLSCALLIVFAKALSFIIKRKDSYYD